MPDPDRRSLQRFNPDSGIQRERLQELRDYQFGKTEGVFDEKVVKDFNFLARFLPGHLQDKAREFLSRANHSQVVEAMIDLLEQEVGESPIATVIEMRVDHEEAVPDFSNQSLYKLLLAKFREMQKCYMWTS